MKTFAEFETWFNSELQKHPMIAKSNPLSLNELCYILRMSEFDFSVDWRTDDGFASIPSVREAFISSRTLALKIEIFGYHEDISCGEIYRSITVRIIGNRTSIPALKPGMPVCIVERDEDGNACDTTGYMFLAQACDYVIVTAWINDLETAKETLEYHVQETAAYYVTDLSVFPLCDCYISKEEAQLALNAERNDDDV